MAASLIQKNLKKRRAQLARDSITSIKDKPEYVAVINDKKLIEDELSHIFSINTIHEIYERYLTTGNPFRFCHVLLMSYYIPFQQDNVLKTHILEPEEWPAIIEPNYLLKIVDLTMPHTNTEDTFQA